MESDMYSVIEFLVSICFCFVVFAISGALYAFFAIRRYQEVKKESFEKRDN